MVRALPIQSHMDKVLVVDDEPEMVELIAMILDDGGTDILTAGDGIEALGIALREHPPAGAHRHHDAADGRR